jgi:hypothetical protein
MPPIPVDNLIIGNVYVVVNNGGMLRETRQFLGFEGGIPDLPRFSGIGGRQPIIAMPALQSFYTPGDPDIPQPVMPAPALPITIPILNNAINIGTINVDPNSNNAINRIGIDIIPSGTNVYIISGPGFRHVYKQQDIQDFYMQEIESFGMGRQLRNPGNNQVIGDRNVLLPGFLIEAARLNHLVTTGGRKRKSRRAKRSRRTKHKKRF